MALALRQAEAAAARGEVPIGAVVVQLGDEPRVVAARHNEREGTHDPTAHAEVLALRDAATALGRWRLDDCLMVVTLEPCPMCAGALWAARIAGVVQGAANPDAGALGSLTTWARTPDSTTSSRWRAGCGPRRPPALLQAFFSAAGAPEPAAPERGARPVGRPVPDGPEPARPATVVGGELPERTNGTVSKTVEVARPPRVRIPHSPPSGPRFDGARSAPTRPPRLGRKRRHVSFSSELSGRAGRLDERGGWTSGALDDRGGWTAPGGAGRRVRGCGEHASSPSRPWVPASPWRWGCTARPDGRSHA